MPHFLMPKHVEVSHPGIEQLSWVHGATAPTVTSGQVFWAQARTACVSVVHVAPKSSWSVSWAAAVGVLPSATLLVLSIPRIRPACKQGWVFARSICPNRQGSIITPRRCGIYCGTFGWPAARGGRIYMLRAIPWLSSEHCASANAPWYARAGRGALLLRRFTHYCSRPARYRKKSSARSSRTCISARQALPRHILGTPQETSATPNTGVLTSRWKVCRCPTSCNIPTSREETPGNCRAGSTERTSRRATTSLPKSITPTPDTPAAPAPIGAATPPPRRRASPAAT